MPFDNLGVDPILAEADRKVHEDVPNWGNILPPIDPGMNPALKKHEEDLRNSYDYEKRADGSWVIKPGFDPPGKRVWGNQARGQVEVPPYSVQQGHAPGPHGMEQHQGGRVIGVADQIQDAETNRRESEAEARRRGQEQAQARAERTNPPRFNEEGKQKDGYATVIGPMGDVQRRHVKSPQYKYAKQGKNGWRLPNAETTRARVNDPAVPPGAVPPEQDMRNLPPGRRGEARDLDAANPVPPPADPAPPADPLQVPDAPPGVIRDTDIPGTQFVNAPGDQYPFTPADEAGIGQPPGGEYPAPTDEMFDIFRRRIGAVNTNPDTGEQWADNDEMRRWFWRNQGFFERQMLNPRGGAVDEDGNPVRGDDPRLFGPFGQRRGVNNPPPQGQPQRPENWFAFPDAPRPPGAPPIMSDPGRPVQGQSRTPAPGMMYGNRQLFPTGPVDPNAAVPGYTPGVDSREYPPFDPNMPFGYQQPAQEWTDTVSAQARRRQRKAGKQEGRAAEAALAEETRRLEEEIPEVSFEELKERDLSDQRIRVGEPDPFAQPGEEEGLYDEFDPALRDQARLTQSKIDAEERAAAIEDLIIKGEEQYLIDHGVISRGEIARLKVELIRQGKMEGESPAQRVVGGLAGATAPDARDTGAPAPSQQLGILQRIKAKRAANRAARQQGRQ